MVRARPYRAAHDSGGRANESTFPRAPLSTDFGTPSQRRRSDRQSAALLVGGAARHGILRTGKPLAGWRLWHPLRRLHRGGTTLARLAWPAGLRAGRARRRHPRTRHWARHPGRSAGGVSVRTVGQQFARSLSAAGAAAAYGAGNARLLGNGGGRSAAAEARGV